MSAACTAAPLAVTNGVQLDFVLPPARWVDVDTLAEATLHGLRDAGCVPPRFAGLDAVLATKRWGDQPGAQVRAVAAPRLLRLTPPGPQILEATAADVPRPGNRDAKRAWRDVLAAAWPGSAVEGDVWIDVALQGPRSLLGPLEVVLDALEPVLGRDPRGRDWQEFFPNDDRVTWLRCRRVAAGPALALHLGQII